MPSASVMMREISSPVLCSSKKRTGSRPTCCCTRSRKSLIARCAATPRRIASENEVTDWTIVAPPTAAAIHGSSSLRPWPMTSSMRNLVLAGSTMPVRRLITSSPRPSSSRRR